MPDERVTALPGTAEIEAAAARIKPYVVETPLLAAPSLGAPRNATILVKAECLQRTGSFKFRGALNALLALDPGTRARGVVAFSSGNHAQGVAAAAQLLGMKATIVMPADAPAIKISNTRGYGAEIVFYDRATGDREAIARRIAGGSGGTVIPPFDDPLVIAGQATVGLELARQAAAMGHKLDAVVVPCSGGGLVGGIALALAAASPATEIFAAEPEGFDDMRRSLASGARVANPPGGCSICDSLLAATPGALPFAIARRYLAGSLVVNDREVRRAMAASFAELKLVIEPGGAAGLAAILAGKLALDGKTVATVASGGNVDRESFVAALAEGTG